MWTLPATLIIAIIGIGAVAGFVTVPAIITLIIFAAYLQMSALAFEAHAAQKKWPIIEALTGWMKGFNSITMLHIFVLPPLFLLFKFSAYASSFFSFTDEQIGVIFLCIDILIATLYMAWLRPVQHRFLFFVGKNR
jgi:hypothetical protein